MTKQKLKKNDKVKTINGDIETVLEVNDVQVITNESAKVNSWYHPSKVWKIEQESDTP